MFDRQNVELDHYLFVVTAHYHEVNRLAGVDVELLMRHKRCEIDKISGTYYCCKFEPLSPTYLAATFHDIDSNFVTAVVMRPRLRLWLKSDRTDPSFAPS